MKPNYVINRYYLILFRRTITLKDCYLKECFVLAFMAWFNESQLILNTKLINIVVIYIFSI